MDETDKKIGEKIQKCLEFIKKECPNCYEKMKECCSEGKDKSRK